MVDLKEQLMDAVSARLPNQYNDGLFTVSMDHCPSEQLSHSDWHTTVLILSCGIEHSDLGKKIGLILRPKTPALMKWKNATNNIKRIFLSIYLDY